MILDRRNMKHVATRKGLFPWPLDTRRSGAKIVFESSSSSYRARRFRAGTDWRWALVTPSAVRINT